jgi:putative peptidoglycan binding protein/HlyD family secretion protein
MRKRTALLIAAGAVAVVTAGVVVWRLPHDAEPAVAALPGGTARVTKRDLVLTEDVPGTLGYADQRELTAYRAGVVTSLAAEGATVKQGQALFAVGLEPAVLLIGTVPAFRTLSTASSDGPDVKQLERALKALGHGAGLTVDDHFSAATADAVEDWEQDLGRADPDGRVELGDIVFAPGNLRIAARTAPVGSQVQPATPLLSVTATSKVVDVGLEVDKSDLVKPGDAVTVALPDDRKTPGKVAGVGTDPQPNTADPNADPTVDMVVTLTKPADAKGFDSGAVTVTIEQARTDDALAVPVTALLALAEGGYAVQVPDASRPAGYRLLGVEVGTVTDDYAGISGAGVVAGLEVVVPS